MRLKARMLYTSGLLRDVEAKLAGELSATDLREAVAFREQLLFRISEQLAEFDEVVEFMKDRR